jgi:hypothetical protein
MQDKDQQICQLLMYTLLLKSTNARIYYEKRLQYTQNQRHYFFGATKCGRRTVQ